MYRIAVITSDLERDWASQELIAAVRELADGDIVDPLSFGIRLDRTSSLLIDAVEADQFDAYIMRGFNRQGETDYQYEMLELLQRRGKLVVNSPAALSISESKAQTSFFLQEAGFPVPRTVVTQKLDEAYAALRNFGMAVVKPLYGSHGTDMEKIQTGVDEDILSDFLERHRVIYLQEYVPNTGRDIRAFVVGDEIPAAVYRIAPEGEWRTNVAQGGKCEPCELSRDLKELCLEATRICGLDYTGVDVIEGPDGPVVLEVNGAPWWHGLLDATQHNVAADIVSHVIQKLDAGCSACQPAWF